VAGLGVNVTEVYPWGRCYLKSFFNILEAWRWGRDVDGWHLTDVMSEVVKLDREDEPAVKSEKGDPITTRITGELIEHVNGLLQLFKSELPLMVPLRSTDAHKLRYIVADVSAEGFSIVT